jgi:SHS2 domain-containing protein
MSYTYLDHDADIGIRCTGKGMKETFQEGGRALLNLVADPKTIRPVQAYSFECHADSLESLFVEYLNEIISLIGRKETVFTSVEITDIRAEKEDHVVMGIVRGEEIDVSRHELKTEVKAATYFGLELHEEGELVTLQCVLDI